MTYLPGNEQPTAEHLSHSIMGYTRNVSHRRGLFTTIRRNIWLLCSNLVKKLLGFVKLDVSLLKHMRYCVLILCRAQPLLNWIVSRKISFAQRELSLSTKVMGLGQADLISQ